MLILLFTLFPHFPHTFSTLVPHVFHTFSALFLHFVKTGVYTCFTLFSHFAFRADICSYQYMADYKPSNATGPHSPSPATQRLLGGRPAAASHRSPPPDGGLAAARRRRLTNNDCE